MEKVIKASDLTESQRAALDSSRFAGKNSPTSFGMRVHGKKQTLKALLKKGIVREVVEVYPEGYTKTIYVLNPAYSYLL